MVEFVSLQNAHDLDTFVMQHPNGHFMQSSCWGKIKKENPWTGLLLRDKNGTIKGSMALFAYKMPALHTALYYAPRGPIFDTGDYDTFSSLVAAAKEYAKQHNGYMLRIDPLIAEDNKDFQQVTKKLGMRCNQASDFSLFQPRMCYVSDLQGLTKDTLASHYHRTTRYKINRSLHTDMSIRIGTKEDIPRFYEMMLQVGKKNNFPIEPQEFFESLLDGLGEHAQLFLAEKDNIPIAATIMVHMADRAWFLYGCSDQNALDDHPNERLQWEMQRAAIDFGCRWFDFRGVEGYPDPSNPKYGLHRYKQGFGAEFRSYAGQLDLTLHPITATAVRVAQKVLKLRHN